MGEIRRTKINPEFITRNKPDVVKAKYPLGKELLDKKFFEKLEQHLPSAGKKILEKLVVANKKDWAKLIDQLMPYVHKEELGIALISQLLGKESFATRYLDVFSDQARHSLLYSAAPRGKVGTSPVKGGQRVSTWPFDKTGSQTYLMGGEFIGKKIIRIVNRVSFEAWKKAFESKEVWEQEGFGYVPIEPIYQIIENKSQNPEQVTVVSGVVGKNLENFLLNKKNRKYSYILNEQAEKIYQILKTKIGVIHGHAHNRNFCVQIHEGEPRLYLIDFDQAEIIKNV